MPTIAFSTTRVGCFSISSPIVRLCSPPGYPEWLKASFLCSLSPLRATLSALMTMTKSPPSTLGANVGLCLPRSRLAAATARRPSTTSVASMTYHDRVVSPALGAYVGTARTFFFSRWIPGRAGCRSGVHGGVISATDIDPRPRRTARQPSSLPMRVPPGQNGCVVPTALHRRDHTESFMRLPCPDAGRPAVGVRHLFRAVAHRASEIDQYLIERCRRLVPFQLLDLVRRRRFAGPQFPQRGDL